MQETFDKALENAQAIEAVIAVSQAEIDEAWSGLLDAIHLLSFEAGDPAALNTLLDIVASLTEENFTTGSWADLQAAVSDAQEAIESGLKAEMDKAYETLYDALNAWFTARTLRSSTRQSQKHSKSIWTSTSIWKAPKRRSPPL
mgnify:CR=1 FL=1